VPNLSPPPRADQAYVKYATLKPSVIKLRVFYFKSYKSSKTNSQKQILKNKNKID